jgi:hypothetical protein
MTDQEKIDLLKKTLEEYAKTVNWCRINYNEFTYVNKWMGLSDGFELAKNTLDIIKKDEIIPKS